MTYLIVLLALISACAAALNIVNPIDVIGSVAGKVKNEIVNDVADIIQPIEEGIVYVASSQCSNVRKMLRDPFKSLGGDVEPDVNDLTFVFRNSEVTITYNISSAAKLIPKTYGFNPDQKFYVFIHGFLSGPTHSSFTTVSNSLFSQGNANVLALDASSLINWLYIRSSYYVSFIGQKLGEVLAEMVEYGVDPAQIHIIGHSLGAHISGYAGKKFKEITGNNLGRISGLDLAGPCFLNVDPDKKLNATDAVFVDVVHTNAGVLGLDSSVGHVDYWPNDGSHQPNCLLFTCSHSRAWALYAESVINPKAFPAIKCDSWNSFKKGNCTDEISYMGHPSNSSASGNYYLRTGGESPYGLGMRGTVHDDSDEGLNGPNGLAQNGTDPDEGHNGPYKISLNDTVNDDLDGGLDGSNGLAQNGTNSDEGHNGPYEITLNDSVYDDLDGGLDGPNGLAQNGTDSNEGLIQ